MTYSSKDLETYPSIRRINFRFEGSRNISFDQGLYPSTSFGPVFLMGLAHSCDTFIYVMHVNRQLVSKTLIPFSLSHEVWKSAESSCAPETPLVSIP
ncbi:hypothetical protein HanPSC8_Chr08g0339761 [Helianthus annuus]|nr:hypothetical protein HanPSC8_Chr08g0339761 [Helianthus annuus]